MRDILFRLSTPELEILRDAIINEQIKHPFKSISLSPILGERAAPELSLSLNSMSEKLGSQNVGAFLDVLLEDSKKRTQGKPYELVWTGPEGEDVFNRDTRVVVQQLFDQAQKSIFIAGFAFYNGRELFKELASRYDASENLQITLCLNVHRKDHDGSDSAAIARVFRETFIKYNWPGKKIPPIFYDPRSLERDTAKKAQLHAKCIVVDGTKSFVGSANFTDKAQLKNIEAGILITDSEFSKDLEAHFQSLIEGGQLLKL